MVELKFRPYIRPDVLAYTFPNTLNTIYIPTAVREDLIRHFRESYPFSSEQAAQAADAFLEEIYPETLAHEAAHLVLGRIAKEEGLPIFTTMEGLHNPLVRESEEVAQYLAKRHAIDKAYKESKARRF